MQQGSRNKLYQMETVTLVYAQFYTQQRIYSEQFFSHGIFFAVKSSNQASERLLCSLLRMLRLKYVQDNLQQCLINHKMFESMVKAMYLLLRKTYKNRALYTAACDLKFCINHNSKSR